MRKLKNNTGLVWQRLNPREGLQVTVARAVRAYRRKFHELPDLCLVHVNALPDGESRQLGVVLVAPGRSVLPGDFWIGVEC